MRKSIKALAIASAIVAGFAATPALHAHDSEESGDAMIGSGIMGQGGMMGHDGPDERDDGDLQQDDAVHEP